MGIIRGGDAEYDDSRPTLEELTPRIEETITSSLEANSKILKLSGKYIPRMKLRCWHDPVRLEKF